jgi:cell division protein FtsL
MKKATLIIWAIILGLLALVIFQNQEFFLSNQSLRIDFGIIEEYLTPQLPVAVLVLIFFFCGVVISYLFNASARFRSRRTIKKLNATVDSQKNEMEELKKEINSLKGIESETGEKASESGFTMDSTRKISLDNTDGGAEEKTEEYTFDQTASNPGEEAEDKSSK